MGIQGRSWRRGRACEAIVELGDGSGRIYVCGKFTRAKDARCDEHKQQQRAALREDKQHRRAS